jgi:organic radical activating enzyme
MAKPLPKKLPRTNKWLEGNWMDKAFNAGNYTAAGTLPIKLITNADLIHSAVVHQIQPVHVQINPTNKCNLKCNFCSCKKRDKGAELSLDQVSQIKDIYTKLGTKAWTITGGGEPCMHPQINEIIETLGAPVGVRDNNLTSDWGNQYSVRPKVALTTNGIYLHHIRPEVIAKLTWCRISLSSQYNLISDRTKDMINDIPIDWSASYVVDTQFDDERFQAAVALTELTHMTHLRVTADILMPQKLDWLKERFKAAPKIIWQGRTETLRGREKCLISLMKPNIGPDGYIYPCCGVQYALDPPSYDFPKNMRMGHYTEANEIYHPTHTGRPAYFNGSVCVKCFYDTYNEVLQGCWESGGRGSGMKGGRKADPKKPGNVTHAEFV